MITTHKRLRAFGTGGHALVAGAVVVTLTTSASADDVPKRARELAEQGRELHDSGDYAGAAARFQQAYALAPSPGLLFNLAQEYRLSGDCEDAAIMYRRFLATDPSPAQRAVAEGHLDKVAKCARPTLAVQTVTPPPPAPPRSVEPVRTDKPKNPKVEKDVGLGFAIAGGAALVGAAYFAYRAHDDQEKVSNGYAMGMPWSQLSDTDADGHKSQRDAMILGIGGGVSLATGAALYMLGVKHERAAIALTPNAGGAKVAVTWGF